MGPIGALPPGSPPRSAYAPPIASPAASVDPLAERRARSLAALLVAMGVLHFVAPRPFERIVPRVLGRPRLWVHLSGVAELAAGILVALPATRRTGGLLATATIVAVYPANWQMALDAGIPPRDAMGVGAWLRLPLQLPLIRWAWRVASEAPAG